MFDDYYSTVGFGPDLSQDFFIDNPVAYNSFEPGDVFAPPELFLQPSGFDPGQPYGFEPTSSDPFALGLTGSTGTPGPDAYPLMFVQDTSPISTDLSTTNSAVYQDFASVPFYSAAPLSDQYIQSYFSASTNPYANSWSSHNYSIIGNDSFPTATSAFIDMYTNPAAGVSVPGGVTTGSQSHVPLFGSVTHYINPQTGTLFNVTNPDHWLAPGYVMRQVVQDSSHQFRVLTVGEGSGMPWGLSGYGAPFMWDGR